MARKKTTKSSTSKAIIRQPRIRGLKRIQKAGALDPNTVAILEELFEETGFSISFMLNFFVSTGTGVKIPTVGGIENLGKRKAKTRKS